MPPTFRTAMAAFCCSPRCLASFHSSRSCLPTAPTKVQFFADGLAEILPYLKTEIIKRSGRASGFGQLPKRWIVERTIAWLNRCRRLAKDWENLDCSGLAFLKLASIRL